RSLPATYPRAVSARAGSSGMGASPRSATARKAWSSTSFAGGLGVEGRAGPSGRAATEHLLANGASLGRLGLEIGERRDVVVPLDQRGHGADAPQRAAVEVPHRIDDVIAVGVEDVATVVGVAGQVDLDHPVVGHAVDVE